MRYFFDLTGAEHSLFDYKGDEFHSLNGAQDFAAAIAQRLANTLSEDWAGWTVEVRSPGGEKHYSVPIREPICVAA
jgi:hypothetical protein